MIKFLLKKILFFLCIYLLASCGQDSKESLSKKEQVYIDRAAVYEKQGLHRSAIIELKKAIQINDLSLEAHYQLAQIYLSLQAGELAEEELLKVKAINPEKENLEFNLIKSYFYKKEYDRVYSEINRIRRSAIKNYDLDILLADTYFAEKKLEKARSIYLRYMQSSPNSSEPLVGYARVLLAEGEKAEAEKILEKILEIDQTNEDGLLLKAQLALLQDKYIEAEEMYYQLKLEDSSDFLTHKKIAVTQGLIRAKVALKKFDEAYGIYNEFLENHPNSTFALYQRSIDEFKSQDFSGAEGTLKKVLNAAPGHSPSVMMLGVVNYALGDFSEAEELLREHVTNNSSAGTKSFELLAFIHLKRDEPHEAKKLMQAALKLEEGKQRAEVYAIKSLAEVLSGNQGSAQKDIKKALSIGPENLSVQLMAGQMYFHMHHYKTAINHLNKVLASDAGNVVANKLFVQIYLKRKHYKQAEKHISQWLAGFPSASEVHYMKGIVELAKKDEVAAKASFKEAVSLEQKNISAASELVKILIKEESYAEAMSYLKTIIKQDINNIFALRSLLYAGSKSGEELAVAGFIESELEKSESLDGRLFISEYFYKDNKLDKAVKYASEAIVIAPDDFRAHMLMGQLRLASGDYISAEESYGKAVQLSPGSEEAYLKYSIVLLKLNKLQPAKKYARFVYEKDRKNKTALITLLTAELRSRDYHSAELHLTELFKLDPDSKVGRRLRADFYLLTSRFKEAAEDYRAILQSEENEALILKYVNALYSDSQHDQALKTAEKWIYERPKSERVRSFLAMHYQQQGLEEEALFHYEQLAESGYNDPQALNNLAWLYFTRGDTRALDTAKKAYALTPPKSFLTASVYDTYGVILVNTGKRKQGIELLKAASELEPDNKAIRQHLREALATSPVN